MIGDGTRGAIVLGGAEVIPFGDSTRGATILTGTSTNRITVTVTGDGIISIALLTTEMHVLTITEITVAVPIHTVP